MTTYGKKQPTVGEGLQLYELTDCYVIKVGNLFAKKIVYETVDVVMKGIFNSTFYLGPIDRNPLLIKDLWLAKRLADSLSKAFPNEKTEIMTWREAFEKKGE